MNIKELLDILAETKFSNLAISDYGEIQSKKVKQIVIYCNEGLLNLYSRFCLKESSVIIEMQDGVTNYHLLKKYALSSYDYISPCETVEVPYIQDLGCEPFQEDVIRILSVYDSYGRQRPMNNSDSLLSVFTPQHNVLQVPNPLIGQSLSIEYQASHPKLCYTNLDQRIELNPHLHGALLSYIAAMYYKNMNTQENMVKGEEQLSQFESICQHAVNMDLVGTTMSNTNNKFSKGGWI